MTGDLLIRSVRPWPNSLDVPTVDVLCSNGLVASIGTALAAPPGVPVVDGGNGVLLPSFTDAHAHLDSTRLGLPFRPHTAGPSLHELIENDRRNWRTAEQTVAQRATHTLGRTIAAGTTQVRSHAQVDVDSGLEKLEGVLAAREAHADRASVEVVAFPQCGILREKGTADLLEAALRAGADLVGGLDPAGYDRDPVRHLDVVFGLAEKHQRGVDIHLHDAGSLGAFQVELICERVAALDMRGKVTISHAFALSTVDADRQRELIELLAEHDVAVTTVAPGTRDPLPLRELRWAGVRLGLGQDGMRDYWSPYGNADMLDRTWQLAYRNGFRQDALIEMCVDIATRGGASVIGHPHGLTEGSPANLLVVPGDTVTAAVMDRAPRTLVVHKGRAVAAHGNLTP
ncbi:cytosine/adenosine deaminase-related metal-dependent hydrolase [Saccharothrix tamanrassetensis]|uniref:Cytosine/adenosine deaminase-related metal-dependent hydrolase n=1 Tax=Saccharothrix tamanrassetensis TaxID=1051531 RepID=A0A841CHL3_9PSEU|nr:amidohydrolase [Saccharothrix tamanrassetensis]MBB5956470.1 cytosine/adenosine deaminase-related metal-dependent hydrolase [Saccharothrix tamanrassetensis]